MLPGSNPDGALPDFSGASASESGRERRLQYMFPHLPEGLDYFVDCVVPELQRPGILPCAYKGKTLREGLGLPRPNIDTFVSGSVVGGEA